MYYFFDTKLLAIF